MTTDAKQPELIHVSRPLKRARLTFEPTTPLDGPLTDGPLIRVGRPLKRVRLTFKPSARTATVRLTVPLAAGADGERKFQTLRSLVEKVNEVEALFDRAGVWVDGTRSEVRDGEVVIVLAPNDPADALDTCKRVADYLFAASRKTPGITLKVFAADEPETPVYELAA